MEWDQILETLAGLPPADRLQSIKGALLILAAMLGVLLIEWLRFRRRGKASSWAWMRVMALVMTPVTVGAVLVPSLWVSGPEALGVFYLLLLGVAPVLWFGSHVWLGRRLVPGITGNEAIALALSGIAVWTLPAIAIGHAEFWLSEAARDQARNARPGSPIVHAVGPVRRFDVPGAGVVLAQSLAAPAGVTLKDVESRMNGPWYPTRGITHATFCTHGNDLHLMWSGQELPPQLRLHTVDASGKLTRSTFIPGTAERAAGDDASFRVVFRDDGFDPEVPIPRPRVFLGFVHPDGRRDQGAPLQARPGDQPEGDCIMPGFRRRFTPAEGRLDAVHLLFYLYGRPPLVGEIRRPADAS